MALILSRPVHRLLILISCVLIGSVLVSCQRAPVPREGNPMPAFRLPALDGPEVDSSSLVGSVVVINFWATWCPPCVDEMPSLERLHQALRAEGLRVLAISEDVDKSVLQRFRSERGLSLPILHDESGDVARRYRTTGFPETFIVDRRGRIVRHIVGPAEWDTPEALDYFRVLLRRVDSSP